MRVNIKRDIALSLFCEKNNQMIPESHIGDQGNKNPFKKEKPYLFSNAEPKNYPLKSSHLSLPIKGNVEPQNETIKKSKTHIETYQTYLNPEILYNLRQIDSLLPALPDEIESKKTTIPPSTKKLLILDLDETLIHRVQPDINYAALGIQLPSNVLENLNRSTASSSKTVGNNAAIIIRPFAQKFIAEISNKFQIAIFTSSTRQYAEVMAKLLDPAKQYISVILSREHCILRENFSLKDLRIIKERSLCDIIIIDNMISAFSGQIENGIYIPSFFGNTNDKELLTIQNFLNSVATVKDVRPLVAKFAGIMRLTQIYKEPFNVKYH